MRILVVSQVFFPDTVSVAQHLSDLCFALKDRGHDIRVLTGRFPYEEKKTTYPHFEKVNGVEIKRIWSIGMGKSNNVGRLVDFFTFNVSILVNLLFVRKNSYDLIIGLTVPPLLSFFSALIAKIKSIRFCYWIMDMQPELAIFSGLIKNGSITSMILTRLGKSTFNNSFKIIVLDRFMKKYLVENHKVSDEKIFIAPVWPVVDDLYTGDRLDNPFRKEHGFGDKIIIMYSGNHSFVHPLDTLLEVAREVESDERFLFVFIGTGVRKKEVTLFKEKYNLKNIIQLPYQPRSKIHLSLGSSDLQVVILGDNLVGFTHPNKIYGALFIGKPILYIGPSTSHITELLSTIEGNILVSHRHIEDLKSKLLKLCNNMSQLEQVGKQNRAMASTKYSPELLILRMCEIIEE